MVIKSDSEILPKFHRVYEDEGTKTLPLNPCVCRDAICDNRRPDGMCRVGKCPALVDRMEVIKYRKRSVMFSSLMNIEERRHKK